MECKVTRENQYDEFAKQSEKARQHLYHGESKWCEMKRVGFRFWGWPKQLTAQPSQTAKEMKHEPRQAKDVRKRTMLGIERIKQGYDDWWWDLLAVIVQGSVCSSRRAIAGGLATQRIYSVRGERLMMGDADKRWDVILSERGRERGKDTQGGEDDKRGREMKMSVLYGGRCTSNEW